MFRMRIAFNPGQKEVNAERMDEAVKSAVRAAVAADGLLSVRVIPKASVNRVSIADGRVRVHVAAPPDKGKANEAALALLAQALGVPRSAVALVRGRTARNKLFRVTL